MNQQLWTFVGLGLYFLLFLVVVLSVAWFSIRRRRQKPPLEIKLLRGPGESLRQRMNKFDEDFLFLFGAAAAVPVVASWLTLGAFIWLAPHTPLKVALPIVLGVGVIAIWFSGRWILKRLFRNRNDRLGYLGERVVGEALIPMVASGYRVFHDIPAEDGKFPFNVDHVVVGPNGLFAIETKTRRKGRAREGFEAHKVAYDGRQLIWPWAEDDFGLQNAVNRARWLSEWLNKMTGLGLSAKPVLALPGWYVVPKGLGPVIVTNHKQLVVAITRSADRVLSNEQIDLIARQLDLLCRDVED
jgi:hypothetical protein